MADIRPILLPAGIRPSIPETTPTNQLFTQVRDFYYLIYHQDEGGGGF